MLSRLGHAVLWGFSFPFVGFCLWAFLFGIACAALKDGGPTRTKLAADLEGFSILTGMLLVLLLGGGGGVAGWLWPTVGTWTALGYVALAVLAAVGVTGVLLWIFGVPHWTLV